MAELTRRSALLAGAGATAGAGILIADPRAHAAVTSSSAADELFTYNGTPAAGTLVASVAAESGTDQSNNSYLEGETAYASVGGTFVACQNSGAAVTFYTAPTETGQWTALAALTAQPVPKGTGLLQFGAGVTGVGVVGPSGDMTGGLDSANIQQALNAFLSVVLLPGMFYLNKPLTMSSAPGQVLSGCGPSTVIQDAVGGPPYWLGSALIKPSRSNLRVTNLSFATNAASFIDFGTVFMTEFECDHITGTAHTSAGDIFLATDSSLHKSIFRDLSLAQTNPNATILIVNAVNAGFSTTTIRDCILNVSPTSSGQRTVPAIKIYSASNNGKNGDNEFVDLLRFENLTCGQTLSDAGNLDNTQYFIDIAANGSGTFFDRISFKNCDFGQVLGGAIHIASTVGITMDAVTCGNMGNVGIGGSIKLANSVIRIETNPDSGQASSGVRIVGYCREGTTNLSGTTVDPSDISVSFDTSQVYIETPSVAGGNALQINIGAAPFAANVQIVNAPSNVVITGYNKQAQPGKQTIVISGGEITIGETPITVP